MGDAAQQVPQEAWDLLQQFYAVREQHGVRKPKRTPKNATKQAIVFLAWSRKKNIDPRLYVATTFAGLVKRKPAVTITLATLRSPKVFEVWDRSEELPALQQHALKSMRRVVRSEREREVMRLRAKPTKQQEAARLHYLDDRKPALCMLDESTGGYDPRSRVCPQCASKYACLLGTNKRHGFDVGALRVGLFDRLPEDVAAIARRG